MLPDSGGRTCKGGRVREARFVGLTADGRSLIVEHDGEHVRLPIDEQVRGAVSGDLQMQIPVSQTAQVSPREIQHRIRCGESAAEIAEKSGVALELIVRFEGPVVAERRHVAQRAQKVTVDGVPLGDRVTALADRGRDGPVDVSWDAWLGDDGEWRVVATFSDGRSACWRWNMQAQRLRPVDDVARAVYGGGRDELEAVLRPVAWERSPRESAEDVTATVRRMTERLTADPPREPTPVDVAADVTDAQPPDDPPAEVRPTDAAVEAAEPAESADSAEGRRTPGAAARRRRAQVPSWDEIVGSRRREE